MNMESKIRGVNQETVVKLLKFLKEKNEIKEINETINRAKEENWSDERWTIDDNISEY